MLARGEYRPNRKHAIQTVLSHERLWGASVKKRHATQTCKNASSAVNRSFEGKRGVIEANGTHDEAGAGF